MEKLSQKDLLYLKVKGFSQEDINWQISVLEQGNNFLKIEAPATIGNGIIKLNNSIINDDEANKILLDIKNSSIQNFLKFVPASGIASRMFSRLLKYINESNDINFSDGGFYSVENTIKHINKFAFADDIINKNNAKEIIKQILDAPLKYRNIPKAMVKFHKYDNEENTPFKEHIIEAINANINNIHFTISKEHEEIFNTAKNSLNNDIKDKIKIDFSFQKSNTDTLSIYEDGKFVRDNNGNILLRPGGHGSLIENLNDLKGNIVYIRNIDNISYYNYNDSKKNINILYLYKILNLLSKHLNNPQKPIRICAMVKNTGEPGGGPFWVKDNNGNNTLQIIEKSQINLSDKTQKEIFENSTHFNPVDIVCYIPKKCQLNNYINYDSAFVASKTYNGKNIKVLERPGLWNGAMSDWTTIFTELPIECFNPVKELNDLLKTSHQKQQKQLFI